MKIRVSIQEFPTGYVVMFMRDNKQIGRTYTFQSEDKVYELLRRAHAPIETLDMVQDYLSQRRPVMVDLELTEEQIRRI